MMKWGNALYGTGSIVSFVWVVSLESESISINGLEIHSKTVKGCMIHSQH